MHDNDGEAGPCEHFPVAHGSENARDGSGFGADEPRVVLEGRRYVVVDKPTGMLSVPGKGAHNHDCAAVRIAARFPLATGPLVVHRLDMDTSGLLLFGLDAGAQRELSKQFESRVVEKWYVALVEGHLTPEEGRIDVPVRPDLTNRPYQVADAAHPHGAVTDWRVLAYETERTRVKFEPRTGRTHQIRVHAAFAGHAIVGDPLYGNEESGPRLMLHAAGLAFLDPDTGRRVEVESPVPF